MITYFEGLENASVFEVDSYFEIIIDWFDIEPSFSEFASPATVFYNEHNLPKFFIFNTILFYFEIKSKLSKALFDRFNVDFIELSEFMQNENVPLNRYSFLMKNKNEARK